MSQKILKYLLFTLVLSLGFGQLLRFEISGVTVYFHDILILFIIFLQAKNLFKIKLPLWFKVFSVGIGVGFARSLTIYSPSGLLVPSLYAFRLYSYLAVYLLLSSISYRLPVKLFYFSGITTVTIGLFQYLFMPDMRVFQYLGWDDHLNRLTLPHYDPSFSGIMIVMYMLLLGKDYMYTGLSIIAVALTYARSVWLSLLATVLLTIRNKKILFLIILVSVAIVFSLPQRFGEGNNLLRTYSIFSRLNSDFGYLTRYQWDLFVGRGMNTLILDKEISILPQHASGPNNSYLYLLLTTGILGLVGWGMFLLELSQNKVIKKVVIFLCIASLFNNAMFYPFSLLLLMLSHYIDT